MNEVYNGGFAPEFSVSMLKETISLVWDYIYETRKQKAKLAEKRNMKSISTETLDFFFRKFLASYALDLAKIIWILLILSQMAVLKERLNKMDMEKIG